MLRCWLASRMPVNCQSFALVLPRSPESDVRCGVNSEYRIELVGREGVEPPQLSRRFYMGYFESRFDRKRMTNQRSQYRLVTVLLPLVPRYYGPTMKAIGVGLCHAVRS